MCLPSYTLRRRLHLPPQTSGRARPHACPHTPIRGATSVPTQISGRGRPCACPRTPSDAAFTCPLKPPVGPTLAPALTLPYAAPPPSPPRSPVGAGLVPALVHPQTPPSPPLSNLRSGQPSHLPSRRPTRHLALPPNDPLRAPPPISAASFDLTAALCYRLLACAAFPAPVAQRIEQRFPKPLAVGSTPTGGALLRNSQKKAAQTKKMGDAAAPPTPSLLSRLSSNENHYLPVVNGYRSRPRRRNGRSRRLCTLGSATT